MANRLKRARPSQTALFATGIDVREITKKTARQLWKLSRPRGIDYLLHFFTRIMATRPLFVLREIDSA